LPTRWRGCHVLKKTLQKTGRVHLAIAEGYRKDGKNKTRTVESLGYLDEFIDSYDDPVAHFSSVAKEMTEQKKEKAAPAQITIHPLQKIDKREGGQRKNIGCAVALSHYNSLGIERALSNRARKRRFEWDGNAILRLLVVERILDPGSKRSAFENRQRYFFRSELQKDDVYRALGFFQSARQA
jgi:hypothetical protein